MEKALSIFFLLLSLLAFRNIAYAQQEIYKCMVFNKAGDYEKAIEFGKLAVKKYPTSSDGYYCLGFAYLNLGELKLAYENMKKAESLANNEKDLMYTYNHIGLILHNMGFLDDALLYYSRSLSLAKDLGNTAVQAHLLNNIASIYNDKGELDKALSYYKESLSLKTNEKDKSTTYNNIALIYNEKGDYQKAVEYLQKAIEIDEKYGDYQKASIAKLNLGNTYRRMKDYENAEKYLSEGLQGVLKVGDKYWVATGCRYSGWFFRDKGDKKEAKECYNFAFKLYKSIGAKGEADDVLNEMKKLDESK